MSTTRSDTHATAPVLCVDLAAEGEDIWPCLECLSWHVEILRDPDGGMVFAREWHAVGCPALAKLLRSDA